ncbi:DUF2254 family protein [Actinophytocola sp.]|uniref:DUF2254 family protein n=1 Tax=Actinophytocola sp. TaxID=1872138 RepID=UPI00389A0CBE
MGGKDRSSGRDAAFRDPLRSSGGLHDAGRLRRGVAEFLRLPLVIIAAFCGAGAGLAIVDAAAGDGAPLRSLALAILPAHGAAEFVTTAATSIVTVTSITFSVLLLAVQQTASNLTPVVFDQFLRRRDNQLYFGFFTGLSAFTLVLAGTARDDRAPVYGAAVTLVLTVAGLVMLLLLIHGTIDQMRPQSVVRSIHELALRARERELVMLGRTRAHRESPANAPERKVTVTDSGYVVTVDVGKLAETARAAGDVEIVVEHLLGEYTVFGDVVATLVGVDPEDDRWDDRVRTAFGLDDIRDVDVESGYATDQLENIAWSAGSSAQQSPQAAVAAIRALRDLLARWLTAGERDRSARAERPSVEPVVYADGASKRVLGSLAVAVVATAESSQAQTCAEALNAFAGLAPRLHTHEDHALFDEVLDSILPAVLQHAHTPPLAKAIAHLEQVLADTGHAPERVGEVRALLSEATRRLLPKPSDEPESTHQV